MRFRELVEEGYRSHAPLDHYARKLGVTTARLNTCCRLTTGKSSLALINERLLTEAKRTLLYSDVTVNEIGAAPWLCRSGLLQPILLPQCGFVAWSLPRQSAAARQRDALDQSRSARPRLWESAYAGAGLLHQRPFGKQVTSERRRKPFQLTRGAMLRRTPYRTGRRFKMCFGME
jgi:hypothetical protein